jgi:AraC-like DNA-binding protein
MPGTEIRPSAGLAPFVASIGYYEGRLAHARERVLPSGAMQLLVNLDRDELHTYADEHGPGVQRTRGAALQGPYARASVIDAAEQRAIVCVAFRLAGAYPFFSVPAAATRDMLVDLDDLWPGGGGTALRDRLIAAPTAGARLRAVEGALLAGAARPLRPDPATAVAGRALQGGASVAEVADRLGWTTRRLARRFIDRVGLSPKRFARVRRFQRLLRVASRSVEPPDWARLAAECGYHDQAHLIHEFREFAGTTPSAYRPRTPGEPNHVVLPASDSYNRDGRGRDRMAA